MMVNCPRCGFTQPKDQYCAKCGVDMLSFKPAETPLAQKLATSWTVQVALLVLLLASVYLIVKGRSHRSLEERLAEMESPAPTTTTQSAQTAPQPRAAALAESSQAQPPPPPEQNNPPPQPAAVANQAANPAAGAAGAAGRYPPGAEGLNRAAEDFVGDSARPTATQVRTLRVQFLEVQRVVVNDLVNNSRNLSSDGTYSAGVVVDLGSRMSAYGRGMRVLDSGQNSPVRMNQPIILFKGVRDETVGANLGVTVQLTPMGADENGLAVQVEVVRAIKDAGGALDERSYQESFVIPKDGGAYLSGTLPRKQMTEAEQATYRNAGVLRVLTSEAFRNSTTDFVILIEGK